VKRQRHNQRGVTKWEQPVSPGGLSWQARAHRDSAELLMIAENWLD